MILWRNGKMKRNLDGIYFRIREEDGTFSNTCFSDMTEKQRNEVMVSKDVVYLRSLCNRLADALKEIGDKFDIVCE